MAPFGGLLLWTKIFNRLCENIKDNMYVDSYMSSVIALE